MMPAVAGKPVASSASWRERYLDLLKRSVTNHLYREQSDAREQPWGLAQAATGIMDFATPAQGHTVMRAAALTHLQLLVDDVITRRVAGDVLEAGVFRGGAAVLMRATLDAAPERTLWLADSFAGIPMPRSEKGVAVDESAEWEERYAASEESVRDVFRRYGYAIQDEGRGGDRRVRTLPGFFNQTLERAPIEQLALVHIDADSYDSVLDVLAASYERVAGGGYIVVDDFYLRGVRAAVFEFRKAHGIVAPLLPVPSDRIATCTPDLRTPSSAWGRTVTPLAAAYWMK